MPQVLFYLSLLVILFTLIPFIRHDFWAFRVFEYPRLQKMVLNIVLVILQLIFLPLTLLQQVVFVMLLINMAYLFYQIVPFTLLGRKQIISARRPADRTNISILIANVYQDNQQSHRYLNLIKKNSPDIILMVETNQWWQDQIDVIGEEYPYQLKMPLENTYGMIFYSRLEIRKTHIHFIVEDDIPSLELEVKIPSGTWIKLYALHPKPPVPQENPRSTERDKEILIVGKWAEQSKMPVTVMGDLNDVAWSYTTRLFGKISGLLDPRRGRGFFNTFHAHYFFLRFPLDHIFCSADFTLSAIRRLENCGSDHFPVFINLQYDPSSEKLNEQPHADQHDLKIADEKMNAETDESGS